MTKQIKNTILALGGAAAVIGAGTILAVGRAEPKPKEYKIIEEDFQAYKIDELEGDLIILKVDPRTAKEIKEVMKDEKKTITAQGWSAWTEKKDEALTEFNTKDFGSIKNKKDFLNKINFLIGEKADSKEDGIKPIKPIK